MEAQQKFHAAVHCYVLTGNAYQLILETREANLSKFMHHLAGCYTTYFNNKKALSGHLFQGRYKAILIDEKGLLLELSRYMHLNPVRARLVKKPEEYKHSSYGTYVLKESRELVSTNLVLGMVSTDPGRARRKYREFVEDGTTKNLPNPLQKVYGQAIAGRPSFVKKVVTRINEEQHLGKAASQRTTAQRASRSGTHSCRIVLTFQDSLQGLPHRQKHVPEPCDLLCEKYTGLTNNEIGERFGNITYSAVTRVAGEGG